MQADDAPHAEDGGPEDERGGEGRAEAGRSVKQPPGEGPPGAGSRRGAQDRNAPAGGHGLDLQDRTRPGVAQPPPEEASARQLRAAAPGESTWLAANAGSGKTRVLTDRVARLLLQGTAPERILCLTYTKAAAGEMQNRLLTRLGQWAMLPDAELAAALTALGHSGTLDAAVLAEARRLFAKAIEAPGGLRIQTIHSFCAALLRRFPLEAGVSHDFTEMDDRAGALLRADILEQMAAGADTAAIDALAAYFPDSDAEDFLLQICRRSAFFEAPLSRAQLLALLGLPPGYDAGRLAAELLTGEEGALFAELLPHLAESGGNDAKAAEALAAVAFSAPAEACRILEGVLLYGGKTKAPFAAKIGDFPKKKLREGAAAHLMPALEALMARVEAARPRRLALGAADRAEALHRFARGFLPRYRAAKARRGWLDFDDLIDRAGALLSDSAVAQWVLFRLDGGIDHILVDEAQDTSPGQWRVIDRLAQEFTAGEGARGITRTIFVVGDRKQSIYSFQGADLAEFERMRDHFAESFAGLGRPLQSLTLDHSFRSSEAILRLVDLAFDDGAPAGLGGATRHLAFQADLPGRVDLWPVIPAAGSAEPGRWDEPLDLPGESDEQVLLARRIAAEIRRMIDAGTRIRTREGVRALHEGDVLILVQRRKALFAEIIRACKEARLAIAGADLLRLGAELAVRDIGAVLAVLATPEDDLSLAAALRSPLFGWSEARLHALAAPRTGTLWDALRADPASAAERAVLGELRDAADFLRPFELIERLLTRHGGRVNLIARLGPEAEDGIDELLTRALAFERAEVPSLTGFLGWLSTGEVEVKRQMARAGRVIRVMTVHGAKGLEAPVVILPDTARRRPRTSDQVIRLGDSVVWGTPAAETPAGIAAARAALAAGQEEERMRLLYVAMTRAESWLIVCAAGDTGPDEGGRSWYAQIAAAMARAKAEPHLTHSIEPAPFGPVERLAFGDWPPDAPAAAAAAAVPEAQSLPDWALTPAPQPPAVPPVLSPSDLGGAKALPADGGLWDEAAARRRGRQIHLLLEHLPGWPEAEWEAIARSLLDTGEDAADPAEADAILAHAARVLRSEDLAAWLAPGALAEVELTAVLPELGGRRIHGTVDRLVVEPARIRLLDYKTNAVPPASAAQVPLGILRQMGAYRAALAQIYPGRPVEPAILWTATGRIMPLPAAAVDAALAALAEDP